MFKKKPENETKMDTTPPAQESKMEWKGGTYNKVLHAIDPKAKGSSVVIKSDLFKKTKTEEVSATATDENTNTTRPEALKKK